MSDPVAWSSMTFGKRLKTVREGRGWSLARLSNESHLAKSSLHGLEQGRQMPSAETLLILARIFEVTMGSLYVGRMDA